MDVALLYLVIPNNEGLSVLKHFLTNEPFKNLVPWKHYFHPAKPILTLNSIAFSNKYYKQIGGVAMGTKMGPNYNNLFVGYIEHIFITIQWTKT